jgi:hypothetical protein
VLIEALPARKLPQNIPGAIHITLQAGLLNQYVGLKYEIKMRTVISEGQTVAPLRHIKSHQKEENA